MDDTEILRAIVEAEDRDDFDECVRLVAAARVSFKERDAQAAEAERLDDGPTLSDPGGEPTAEELAVYDVPGWEDQD